jgi:hypothetical protein
VRPPGAPGIAIGAAKSHPRRSSRKGTLVVGQSLLGRGQGERAVDLIRLLILAGDQALFCLPAEADDLLALAAPAWGAAQ